jgi:hypothetical protein
LHAEGHRFDSDILHQKKGREKGGKRKKEKRERENEVG